MRVEERRSVNIDLGFLRDTNSELRQVQETLSATLTVACQRCLEKPGITLRLQLRIFLLKPGKEKGLPRDEADFLVIEKHIAISELIEDELHIGAAYVSGTCRE